jgi:hypothetical protein
MIISNIKQFNTKNLVQISEEFNFKNFIWEPNFPIENLKSWFDNIKINGPINVELFLNDFGLLWSVDNQKNYTKALKSYNKFPYYHLHLCCTKDSFLIIDNNKFDYIP